MKRALKICLIAILVISAGYASAQTQKFAHIDLQALIPLMPETATAQKELEKQSNSLQNQMTSMRTEYDTKLKEFSEQNDSLTEIVRQAKIEDLQNLEQRIQNFNQMASQQLQQKQSELMQPILAKANETIEAVAKELGVLYVFDSNVVLYKSNESIDLLPLTKTKLGL